MSPLPAPYVANTVTGISSGRRAGRRSGTRRHRSENQGRPGAGSQDRSVEACAGKALHSAGQWVTDGLPRLGPQPADEGAQDEAAVDATLHGVTALAMSLRPRCSMSSR